MMAVFLLPEVFLVKRDGESLVFQSPLLYITASGIYGRNRCLFDLSRRHCTIGTHCAEVFAFVVQEAGSRWFTSVDSPRPEILDLNIQPKMDLYVYIMLWTVKPEDIFSTTDKTLLIFGSATAFVPSHPLFSLIKFLESGSSQDSFCKDSKNL